MSRKRRQSHRQLRRNLGHLSAFFLPCERAERKLNWRNGGPRVEQSLDGLLAEEGRPKPYRRIEGDLSLGLLILCDHAENTLPEAYGTLGLRSEDLHRHIAYDLGAAGVTEHLANALGAPALLTRFSRLLIDPNRGVDDPTLIMQLSDGLIVPANVGLSAEEIEARVNRFYLPYHRAVDRAIEAGISAGKPPVVLSVHSFTQAWKGVPRPWHVSVLWDKDPRLALPLLEALRAFPDIEVGDNVPYSGQLKGDALYRHATSRGLAHALVEVRQDLILAEEGQAEWGGRLATALSQVMRTGGALHAIELHGSNNEVSGHAGACAAG